MITVEPVSVLGTSVGCLWDVFLDNRRVGRVTYHGNTLIEIKRDIFGRPWDHVTKGDVEKVIENFYERR